MTETIMNSADNYNNYSDDATYRDYDDSEVKDEYDLTERQEGDDDRIINMTAKTAKTIMTTTTMKITTMSMTTRTKTMQNTMTITTTMSTLAKDDNSDDIDEAND